MRRALKVIAWVCGALVAGCATAVPSELVKARDEYQVALAGAPGRLTPSELYQAQKYLNAANKSFENYGDAPATSDWAYITRRKIEVAQTRARSLEDMACATSLSTQLQAAREQQLKAALARSEQFKDMPSAKVTQDTRGTVVTLPGGVLFSTGKSTLSAVAEGELEKMAKALKTEEGKRIIIEGHTDSLGSEDLNRTLSLARALSVKQFLVSKGVPEEMIETKGMGESHPVAPNDTPENRANNRRVEVVIQTPEPVGAL